MFVELADKLIGRILELIKHKRQSDRELFFDLVQPVYDEFSALHAEYLGTFRKYRELARFKSCSIDDLIDLIHEEHLFSEGQRVKLSLIPTIFVDNRLEPFASMMHEYLTRPDFDGPEQRWRLGLLMGLKWLRKRTGGAQNSSLPSRYVDRCLEEGRKPSEIAIGLIDGAVACMQERYAYVSTEYLSLKQKLLAGKSPSQ